MPIQDIDEAKNIVLNYVETSDRTMEVLLEESKGKYYRPWIVAAFEIQNQYEQLIKADIATFNYDKNSVRGLLNTQATMDFKDDNIPEHWSVDNFLIKLEDNAITDISVNIH